MIVCIVLYCWYYTRVRVTPQRLLLLLRHTLDSMFLYSLLLLKLLSAASCCTTAAHYPTTLLPMRWVAAHLVALRATGPAAGERCCCGCRCRADREAARCFTPRFKDGARKAPLEASIAAQDAAKAAAADDLMLVAECSSSTSGTAAVSLSSLVAHSSTACSCAVQLYRRLALGAPSIMLS